jgi:mRNA interferase MazF
LNPVVGSEQGESRPVLIVQNNLGNRHSPTVIVAPITGKLGKTPIPTHVLLLKSCGLEMDSLALIEQVRAIDRSRLDNYIGFADKKDMSQVDTALLISIGIQMKEGRK